MEETQLANQLGRDSFAAWQKEINQSPFLNNADLQHTLQLHLSDKYESFKSILNQFGEVVVNQIEPLVNENNLAINLPHLNAYNAIGERVDQVIHHPSYVAAGDLIYGSGLLKRMTQSGGLSECLALLFLSAHTGEAGHNCPIACSAGIIRVLQKTPDFPNRQYYLDKLTALSFQENFTGAQFLTEIQGGSDVGLNAVTARQDDEGAWRIKGEKWFCSNANADLIFITARYDENSTGTKGLALFLIPALWEGEKNAYTIRRLKEKIGTRSMATGEIDFHDAKAIQIGSLDEGFHLVMDNVLHLSRMFNAICVLGMARRAYAIAHAYAKHRVAFSHAIIHYPLIKENLARIKVENNAMVSAIFHTIAMQDKFDQEGGADKKQKLLLRQLVNILKYITALWSVEHIHHALDVLAGNGTIETFSPIPRLLRDCIVCENWEGAHNVLRMQVMKDVLKYQVDEIYIAFIQSLLDGIADTYEYKNLLLTNLHEFKQQLKQFHDASDDIKSLQIRLIVDKMAVLYCAATFLKEAIAQEKSGYSSKLTDFKLFYLLHFNQNALSYDAKYLQLIDDIIS